MKDVYFEVDEEFLKKMNNHLPKNFNLATTLNIVNEFIAQMKLLI